MTAFTTPTMATKGGGVVDSLVDESTSGDASGEEFPSHDDNDETGDTQPSGTRHTDTQMDHDGAQQSDNDEDTPSFTEGNMDTVQVVNSMMASMFDPSASNELEGHGESPSLDANDNGNTGEAAGAGTVQTEVEDVNMQDDQEKQTETDEESVSSSDSNMDITPDGSIKMPETGKATSPQPPQMVIQKDRKTLTPKKVPPREQPPVLRPRKRKRIKSEIESDEEDNVHEDQAGSSAFNPIDVDLYASIWEAIKVTDPVSRWHTHI